MYGMDLSNYQAKLDLSKGNYDFCIIKATDGVGFTDKSFEKRATELMQLGKLIGAYHFARPDLHATVYDMRREADWFISEVKRVGLLKNAILVLDWETEPMDRPDLIEAWTSRVEEITGVVPFIYGSRSKLNKWKDYNVIKNHPIWLAIWPNTKRYNVGENPNLPAPNSSVSWIIWQYSASGVYPDFPGNVDLDYCNISREEWLYRAGYINRPEKISDDMKWAIEAGLFAGYPDGTYREDEPLTRGQAASLFRRMFTITMKNLLNSEYRQTVSKYIGTDSVKKGAEE